MITDIAGNNVDTPGCSNCGGLGRVGLQHKAGTRMNWPPGIVGAEAYLELAIVLVEVIVLDTGPAPGYCVGRS